MIASAFDNRFCGTLRLNSVIDSSCFATESTQNTRIANVTVLTPPAVPVGDPPMIIRNIETSEDASVNAACAPVFPTVWQEIAPRIEGLTLVAHNKAFDESCLKAVFRTYGMDYPDYDFHCTLQASRRAIKGLPDYQLHTVAAWCGYRLEQHHHALADAEACAWIARQVI